MSKEITNLIKHIKWSILVKYQQELLNEKSEVYKAFDNLEQALTPTPLNELRDEIISELNIINLGRVGKGKWIYQNNKFIKKEKDNARMYYSVGKNLEMLSLMSLQLAHKITTYFMRLEDEV